MTRKLVVCNRMIVGIFIEEEKDKGTFTSIEVYKGIIKTYSNELSDCYTIESKNDKDNIRLGFRIEGKEDLDKLEEIGNIIYEETLPLL